MWDVVRLACGSAAACQVAVMNCASNGNEGGADMFLLCNATACLMRLLIPKLFNRADKIWVTLMKQNDCFVPIYNPIQVG